MPYEPPPELAELSLEQVAELVAARKLPPVSEWQPERRTDSQMRVAADGKWYHQGGEITRPAMIRAFSSLLRRERDGSHWLVTPQEMQSVDVDDAAFLAVDVKQDGEALAFRLNTDDLVVAGPDHPIIARGDREVPALYLGVRNGTEARLNRSTYGQLIEIALTSGGLTVRSQGAEYPLEPA